MFQLRAHFDQTVAVLPEHYQWVASPMAGVERMMLDRVGEEVARATSLVRYAPNSEFSPHRHDGGEEFFVLSGVFSDEHGDYPAGSYVRNPIGTQHQPRIGPEGATIFVKLRQFERGDTAQINLDTRNAAWPPESDAGQQRLILHTFRQERVALLRWAPSHAFASHELFGGQEMLVLEGGYRDEFGTFPAGSWVRYPHQSSHAPRALRQGALILAKTGHLLNPPVVYPAL